MPDLTLEFEILRKGRREDRFDVQADPENVNLLRGILINWLQANRWDEGRWGEFEMYARLSGDSRVLKKVRAR